MRKILLIGNYKLDKTEMDNLRNCDTCGDLVEFVFEATGRVDLVCVLNTVRMPMVVRAPMNKFVKLVQEPNVKASIFHKFVTSHPRVFSKVWGHHGSFSRGTRSIRFEETAPLLFPQVHASKGTQPKTQLLSIISSTLSSLPGHKLRNEFIEKVQRFHPELKRHTFGRGRVEVSKKDNALDAYMYSLAIENSQIPSFITEKLLDCILREAVPVYFGAVNVHAFFPEDSVVQIKSLDELAAKNLLLGLSRDDYNRRLPALLEAKRKYLNEMRICCMLTRELQAEEPGRDKRALLLPPLGEVLKWAAASRFRWANKRNK